MFFESQCSSGITAQSTREYVSMCCVTYVTYVRPTS